MGDFENTRVEVNVGFSTSVTVSGAGVGVSSAGGDATEAEDAVGNYLHLLRDDDGDSTATVIPISCIVGVGIGRAG